MSCAATALINARSSRNLSLRDVADQVGYTPGHISRIERGEIQASPETAKKLANFFNNEVTRDQILFPEEYVHDGGKKTVKSSGASR